MGRCTGSAKSHEQLKGGMPCGRARANAPSCPQACHAARCTRHPTNHPPVHPSPAHGSWSSAAKCTASFPLASGASPGDNRTAPGGSMYPAEGAGQRGIERTTENRSCQVPCRCAPSLHGNHAERAMVFMHARQYYARGIALHCLQATGRFGVRPKHGIPQSASRSQLCCAPTLPQELPAGISAHPGVANLHEGGEGQRQYHA